MASLNNKFIITGYRILSFSKQVTLVISRKCEEHFSLTVILSTIQNMRGKYSEYFIFFHSLLSVTSSYVTDNYSYFRPIFSSRVCSRSELLIFYNILAFIPDALLFVLFTRDSVCTYSTESFLSTFRSVLQAKRHLPSFRLLIIFYGLFRALLSLVCQCHLGVWS